MLSTGEIDSEFVSKHEFGNEWLASTSDPYFEFTIAKFFFLPQRAEISPQCTLKAFLSPQRPNVTRWLNYLAQRAEILTHRSLQSFLSPQRANVN